MESKYDADEYLDALVTLELAAVVAQKEKRPVNTAVRACWRAISHRVNNDLNRKIFRGVSRQVFCHGALCMLRRQLDEAISE